MQTKHVRKMFSLITTGVLVFGLSGVANAQVVEEEVPPPLVGKMLNVGEESFEPTLGVDAAGRIYYSVTRSPGVAIGWRPGTYMSDNGGTSFRDISPTVVGISAPPETNDPFIWVDQETGRVFSFHMAPILACSAMMSYTDNAGASWTTTPLGCGGEAPYDHQTMVASKPRTLPTQGYPNVLNQCVNAVHSEQCSRSVDGGLTWSPTTPAYPNEYATQLCGTQTGHMASAPDGTIYLPTPLCAHSPAVYVSDNDGLTWTRRVIDGSKSIPFVDPAIAVDELGNVYASFIDSDGNMWYSVSKDKAVTWSVPVHIAQGITGHLPALDVGDPGKVVVAFPGTDDLEEGYSTAGYPGNSELTNSVEWHAYMAISYNGLDAIPTFETVNASGTDPLVRRGECGRGNRCGYHVDFIDVTIGPNGLPYAAFIDGCTNTSCITNPLANNNEGNNGKGVIATLASGTPLCETGCAYRFGGTPTAPGARRLSGR